MKARHLVMLMIRHHSLDVFPPIFDRATYKHDIVTCGSIMAVKAMVIGKISMVVTDL